MDIRHPLYPGQRSYTRDEQEAVIVRTDVLDQLFKGMVAAATAAKSVPHLVKTRDLYERYVEALEDEAYDELALINHDYDRAELMQNAWETAGKVAS